MVVDRVAGKIRVDLLTERSMSHRVKENTLALLYMYVSSMIGNLNTVYSIFMICRQFMKIKLLSPNNRSKAVKIHSPWS